MWCEECGVRCGVRGEECEVRSGVWSDGRGLRGEVKCVV